MYLYARREEVCNDINNFHYNSQYYPNINIDKIGNFGMAIYVFYTSIKMIIQKFNN